MTEGEKLAAEFYAQIQLHERMSIVRSMDFIVRMMQHEMAYEEWILTVPDEADEMDYMYIAMDDELFKYVEDAFVGIVKAYGKHGW